MRRNGFLLVFLLLGINSSLAQRSDLSGLKFCIDPGHGGHNPANDRHLIPDPGTDFWESESNFQKALLLKALLEAKSATVILTRYTNDYPNDNDEPSLAARVALANANNVHWFHSIHSNASGIEPNTSINYTLMLVREKRSLTDPGASTGNGLGVPETQEALDIANIIGPKVNSKLRTQRTITYLDWTFYGGTNGGFSLGVLRGLLMPGELSEGSFHDYYPETRRLMNNSYRKMEAYALRDAFMQYYSVPSDTLSIIAGIMTERGIARLVNSGKVRLLPENVVYAGDSYNNGFYMFDSLKPGSHTLRFETPGYLTDSVQVNVGAGSTVFIDKEFESLAAPVVISNSPINNDTAFAASGQIKIVFSKVMDTVSVRSAFSITPSVTGSLLWSSNNTTLVFKPDSVLLPFNVVFTLRIEGTARSQSGLFLDGNGDGSPGDPFNLTFRTRPVDAWPPRIVSAFPSASTVLRSPNHMINLTFDEPLDPNTVTLSNFAMQYARTLQYWEAGGKGAVNIYVKDGLQPGQTYTVRVSGVADLSGNVIPNTSPIIWQFSVAAATYQYTAIDDFNLSPSNWWQPSASGSTVGIDSASFAHDSTVVLPTLPSNTGAAHLRYSWRTSSSDWLIREYLNLPAAQSVQWKKEGARLQVYINGDGSGTLFRFAIDDSVDAFPLGRTENHEVSQWIPVDWVGWRLVEWDLENDSVGSWIGNGKLEGTLRFDSFQLKYVPGTSAPSGRLYFDQLQIAKKTVTLVDRDPGVTPVTFELYQNYPNPFNPITHITYDVAKPGFVRLAIFDLLGRQVGTLIAEEQQQGRYVATWDARDDHGVTVASGIYLYRLQTPSGVLTKKMVLLK